MTLDGRGQVDDPNGKGQVTETSNTKQVITWQCLGLGPSNLVGISSGEKMTLRANVMVNITMTFRTASLLSMLFMIQVSDIGPSWSSSIIYYLFYVVYLFFDTYYADLKNVYLYLFIKLFE